MLKVISDFGKALEMMSKEIEKVPMGFYWIAGALIFLWLCLYFIVIPRIESDVAKREKYRVWCIYGLLILYIVGIFCGKSVVNGLLNCVFFLPVGILSRWVCRGKWRILSAFCISSVLSIIVEIGQLVGICGTFSADNMLFNVLGGLAGIFIFEGWVYAFSGKSILRYCMRVFMVLFGLVILCGFGGFGTYHFLRMSGAKAVKENISTVENRMASKDTSEQMLSYDPDLIWYGGKAYRYNENLVTFLIMGIDQRSEEIEQIEGVSGESGQADTIVLLVMDQEESKMKVISISRDTMTDIQTYDYKGNYLGQSVNHIGLAYAFGDGKDLSCQYMVDAVSNLFYGIPINGYAALNMQAVIRINDAVGGVPVYIEEDMTQADSSLIQGQTINLTGTQALTFIKWRDTSIPHSNNLRVARQKQYLVNFMKQATAAVKNDVTLPVTLYQDLTNEMVTDIGMDKAVYLATQALEMSLDESGITMLKSESVEGNVYDEVYVDDEALYELILDVFYKEEKTEGREN